MLKHGTRNVERGTRPLQPAAPSRHGERNSGLGGSVGQGTCTEWSRTIG